MCNTSEMCCVAINIHSAHQGPTHLYEVGALSLDELETQKSVVLKVEVVVKVVAGVVQESLQGLAEEVLPESQCSFRRGRGCSDMIFTV